MPRSSSIFNPAPNPAKVTLYLEETGLPYELMPIDTRRGQQLEPAFLKINPNGKGPAIVDGDATVFDSTAILLYLAEKTGQFLSANTPALRGEMLSWLLFVASGGGPSRGSRFTSGMPRPKTRMRVTATPSKRRHYRLLEERLSTQRYLVGDA